MWDDLKRIFMGPTLFRLDTILSPRLVPVLYGAGLGAILLWGVTHLFATFGRNFGDGLWGLLEIAIYGLLALIALRVGCEALLVWFKTNDAAADSVSRMRPTTNLLDEVRDAIRDIADEDDDPLDDEELIAPATVPIPDVPAPSTRSPRRTARRTPRL